MRVVTTRECGAKRLITREIPITDSEGKKIYLPEDRDGNRKIALKKEVVKYACTGIVTQKRKGKRISERCDQCSYKLDIQG